MARKIRWFELAFINTPDSRFAVATRYLDQVWIGGQVGGVDDDEWLWANENYPGSVHENLDYWGFWAGNTTRSTRTTAGDLRIDGMTLESSDIARIPATTATAARFDVLFAETGSSRTWEKVLANCATGVTTITTTDALQSFALPPLTAGSYLLRTRVVGETKPYTGLPSDYQTVTGKSPTNASYRWTHPTLGAVYYDPIWNVGALPYDGAASDQAALLAARALAVSAGTARKWPAWTDELVSFNGDGTLYGRGGEWSMLRVVVGAGDWIGDANVHINATAGAALWTAGETLVPIVQMIDPTMRSVGAFKTETIDGAAVLWIGDMVAGRSGRTIALHKMVDGEVEQSVFGTTSVVQRWCECALSSESITGIERDPVSGVLYISTYCERFAFDEANGELIPAHPGGRSIVVARKPDGSGLLAYATESDFANSDLHKRGFNYILSRDNTGWHLGPGTAHHVDSCLAAHAGYIWGIEETGDASGFFTTKTPASERRQYLARYNGSTWQRMEGVLSHGWKASERDLGPMARARGALVVFGQDATGQPTALRYQGSTIEKNITSRYHPRNPQTCISADGTGENILAPARKRDAEGNLLDGWYLVETTGKAAVLVFTYNPECGIGGCFCIPLSELIEAGVDVSELPTCLQWSGSCWKAGACSGTNWLELIIDEEAGTACYHVHGTLPYDPADFDGLEWMDGRECVNPIPAVNNPVEALERMPEGTVAYAHRVRVDDGGLISALQIAGTRDEAEIEGDYPFWLWLGRVALPDEPGETELSEAMTTALESYTTRAKLDKPEWLELPADSDVYICYLIPPTKHIAPAAKAVF